MNLFSSYIYVSIFIINQGGEERFVSPGVSYFFDLVSWL
jgi:hypothetical protein